MTDTTKKLIHYFNYLFSVFPLTMAVFLGFVYLLGGWGSVIDGHMPKFYFLKEVEFSVPLIGLLLLWLIALCGLSFLFYYFSRKINKPVYRKALVSIFIFILAFGVRYLILYIWREDLVPFSDFARSWELARGNFEKGHLTHYSLFPAYLNFSVYENFIIKIFEEIFVNILYLNAAYSGITAVLLYFITRELTENELICILSGAIYALYPANIFYTATATPEFIAILFNTIGVYALIKAYKYDVLVCRVLWVLLGSLSLGIGGSYKTYSIVMLVAFIIVLVFSYVVACRGHSKNEVISIIALVIIGILGFRYTTVSILDSSSHFFNVSLTSEKPVPHFLLVGLNTESEGQIHVGTLSRRYYKYYLSNGRNYEAAKKYAYDLLKNDWKNNTKNILPNFGKKMIWSWQDDYIPIHYFLNNVGLKVDSSKKRFVYNAVAKYGAGVGQFTYLLIIIFAAVATISNVRKENVDYIYEFISLIIFGYFCMILLAEGQSRYKCLVMPYIIILSSLGVQAVFKRLKLL